MGATMRIVATLIVGLFVSFNVPFQMLYAQGDVLCQEYEALEYYQFGVEAYAQDDHDTAIDLYGCALELMPQLGNVYVARIGAYLADGTYEIALTELENFSNYPDLEPYLEFTMRAAIYFAEGDFENAISEGEKALTLKDDSFTHNILGVIYAHLGDYQSALFHHTRAIEIEPTGFNSYVYLFNRGYAYYNLGDTNAARADFEAALTLEPDLVALIIDGIRDARRRDEIHLVIIGLIRLLALRDVLEMDFEISVRV
jgi:tetratricopeptide (TPR) repeat protein